MKKTLIALAAIAATSAFAQSTVTLYGVLDQGYNTNEFSAAGVSYKTTGIKSILSGNRLGFKGTEDLGGGLKANFQYELSTGLDAAEAVGTTNRNSFVEVAGNFGSVKAGQIYTLIHDVQGTFDPSANATAAGYIGGTTSRVRQANSLTYTSPVMSGFSAQVQLGFGETADYTGTTTANKSDSQAFAVKYAAGPVVVMLAHEKVTFGALTVLVPTVTLNTLTAPAAAAVSDSLADQTATSFGGSYDFGMVKAMYLNTTAKAGSAVSSAEIKTQTLGVSAPIGAVTLNASVGKGDATDQANNSLDLKGYQVGANYALSKRTTAYTIFGKTSYEEAGLTLDNKTFAVGVRHTF